MLGKVPGVVRLRPGPVPGFGEAGASPWLLTTVSVHMPPAVGGRGTDRYPSWPRTIYVVADLRQAEERILRRMPGQSTPRKGPRGGETTVTKSGMVRKTIWLHDDEAEALREKAYQERRSESEMVREALRAYLGIKD